MKRKILIFIIVSLLLVATAFLKKSFSAVNVNVEKKYSFLDINTLSYEIIFFCFINDIWRKK